jgi:hypothetical protein
MNCSDNNSSMMSSSSGSNANGNDNVCAYGVSDDIINGWLNDLPGWRIEDVTDILGKIGKKRTGVEFRQEDRFVDVTSDMIG